MRREINGFTFTLTEPRRKDIKVGMGHGGILPVTRQSAENTRK